LEGYDSLFQIQLLHSVGEHHGLSFSSPSLYEARIVCTFSGRAVSIFDVPVKQLSGLIDQYHKQTKSNVITELTSPSKAKKKNIVRIVKDFFQLYLREKVPTSFFSSMDIITIDEPTGRPVGRTVIELDADIVNFMPLKYADKNIGVLFLLHQTSVALVLKIFNNKSEDLQNWLDRKIRIVKLFSFFIGFVGPVILNDLSSNSSDLYSVFEPLLLTLSYFGFFALWYKFAPKLILRLFIRVVVKKIMG
jgi:hypothetical protein